MTDESDTNRIIEYRDEDDEHSRVEISSEEIEDMEEIFDVDTSKINSFNLPKDAGEDSDLPKEEDEYTADLILKREDDKWWLRSEGYVGVLKLSSGRKIEILPKDATPDESMDSDIQDTDLDILSMWGYVNFRAGSDSNIDRLDMDTGEAFIYSMAKILSEELDEILRKGLNKEYVKVQGRREYLKGKLLIKEQLRAPTDEKFHIEYEEISRNNQLNQLLLFATDRLKNLMSGVLSDSEDVNIHNKLNQQYSSLSDNIDHKTEADILPRLDEIVVDSTNSYYQTAVDISKKVVTDTYYSTDASGRDETPVYSFLIDMNYLFEEFIRELLSDIYESAGKGGRYLFNKNCSFDGKRRIKPDLVLNEGESVGDVKYKEYNNGNVDIADYHQILTYSTVYDSDTFIVFLGEKESGEAEVNTAFEDDRRVHLIGFNPDSTEDDFVENSRDHLEDSFEDLEGIPDPE